MNFAKTPTSLREIISNLAMCVSEDVNLITVRRAHVLEDALRATGRKAFTPQKQLKVCIKEFAHGALQGSLV